MPQPHYTAIRPGRAPNNDMKSELTATAPSSETRPFIVLSLICLCVVAVTIYLPNLHIQIYKHLASNGTEIHKASFLGHITQILIYDIVLIGSTLLGLRFLRIPLPEIGWRKPEILPLARSVAIMFIALLLVGEAYSIFKTAGFKLPSFALAKNWGDLGNTSVYIFLFTSVLNAPVEEVFYRGFLLTAIKKRTSAIAAITLSSLVYAAAHFNVSNDLLQILISGIILALLKTWGDNLWNPIAAHLIKNASASWFFIRF